MGKKEVLQSELSMLSLYKSDKFETSHFENVVLLNLLSQIKQLKEFVFVSFFSFNV